MNNLMSKFSGLALTRMEMKKITGGCYVQTSSGAVGGLSKKDAIAFSSSSGTHWCCTCSNASWMPKKKR